MTKGSSNNFAKAQFKFYIGGLTFLAAYIVLQALTSRLTSIADQSSNPDRIHLYIRLLPWIVNGVALLIAFRFHPIAGVGYISTIALFLIAPLIYMPVAGIACSLFGISLLVAPFSFLIGIAIVVYALISRSAPPSDLNLGIKLIFISVLPPCLLFALGLLIAASPTLLVGLGVLAIPLLFQFRWLFGRLFADRSEKPPGSSPEEVEQDSPPPSPPMSRS